jgi:DNA replication protein DnaC
LSDYLTDIALARQENTYRKILKKYTNPKLLIIDEWLLVPPNEQERREMAELIHKRRRHASTIFCSQYDDREWFDQLGGGSRVPRTAHPFSIENGRFLFTGFTVSD